MKLPVTLKRVFGLARSNGGNPVKIDQISGWVKNVRPLKTITFVEIQDGTTLQDLNVVLKQGPPSFRPALGQSVTVLDPEIVQRKNQQFETICLPHNLRLVGATTEYPIQNKQTALPTLRKLPEFKHRTTYLSNLMRFRHKIESRLSKTLDELDFTLVKPPILTSIDCEGAGEMFKLKQDHWDKAVNLTVSSQLQLEVLMMGLGRVYCLQPCFRAEKSDTNRHLCEFWMMEVEASFIGKNETLMDLVELMIKNVVSSLCETEDLPKYFPVGCNNGVTERWAKLLQDWNRITYTKAVDLLLSSGVNFEHELTWGKDLNSEHERWLCDHFGGPVFVTNYPRDCKAFYMKLRQDNATVECFDLLFPDIGEIVGGSIREDNYDTLKAEIQRRNMDPNELEWYLNLRKEGTVPHGGFGIGIERLVSYLYGNPNIRDSIPFHRTTGQIDL
ncbi:unnamed protein product [Kluyveromyces dobzhanskii CBS 2104]|uniref:asparagine--tRNA ligase n=1 Tax=Kluyveromyces dobzhanskii CBS 2104 TaxID=1427455 RepID=A0A0A8KZJ8_9SACH|nr:unnamed protein product [Kluyveromyces dobzhanskii CBS 2104]